MLFMVRLKNIYKANTNAGNCPAMSVAPLPFSYNLQEICVILHTGMPYN